MCGCVGLHREAEGKEGLAYPSPVQGVSPTTTSRYYKPKLHPRDTWENTRVCVCVCAISEGQMEREWSCGRVADQDQSRNRRFVCDASSYTGNTGLVRRSVGGHHVLLPFPFARRRSALYSEQCVGDGAEIYIK